MMSEPEQQPIISLLFDAEPDNDCHVRCVDCGEVLGSRSIILYQANILKHELGMHGLFSSAAIFDLAIHHPSK